MSRKALGALLMRARLFDTDLESPSASNRRISGDQMMKGMRHGWIKAGLIIVIMLSMPCCYHIRPDELQPEYITSRWDQRFPKHTEFTEENVLLVAVGMTDIEVKALFGPPDRTFFKTYWDWAEGPWQGLVYEYDMGRYPKGKYNKSINTFLFTINQSSPRLIHWDFQLVYSG